MEGFLPQNSGPAEYLLGVHEFKARSQDELDIRQGDYILVIEDDAEFGDSWFSGRNLTTGEVGLFPKVFTTSIVGLPPGIDPAASISSRPSIISQESQERDNDEQLTGSMSSESVMKSSVAPVLHTQGSSAPSTVPSSATLKDLGGSHVPPVPPQSGPVSHMVHAGSQNSPAAASKGLVIDTAAAVTPHLNGRSDTETPASAVSVRHNSGHPSLHKTMSDIDEALSEIAAAKAPSLSNIGFWTPQEVRAYFLSRGYDGATAEMFVKHQITGTILLELDLAFLKEIEIASFGTRFEISKDIKSLNQYFLQSSQTLPSPDAPVLGGPRTPNLSESSQPATATTMATSSTAASTPDPNIGAARWTSPAEQHQQLQPPKDMEQSVYAGFPAPDTSRQLQDSALPHTPPVDHIQNGGSQWPTENTGLSTPTSSNQTNGATPMTGSETSEEPHYFYKNSNHARSVSDVAFPTNSLESPSVNPRSASSGVSGHHRRHSSILSVMPNGPATLTSSAAPKPNTPKRQGTFKGLRSASSQYLRPALIKQKTSAFVEGIKSTTAKESAESAEFSGWMQKRGGIGVGTWKSRYFTLHGTRLSYFTTFKDEKERGLIDITGHRVLAAKENEDKLVSLYAVGVGAGRFCFKLVPPGPGYKKGMTFTAPKIHYFAVETLEEMRGWMGALMKATIERDSTAPVVSSCTTPTVSLPRARELVAQRLARQSDSEDDSDDLGAAVEAAASASSEAVSIPR